MRAPLAEEWHRAHIAHLEAEAAESRDAATRDAQARAEAEADHMLAAEWDRMHAEAELTTLTDKLALTTLADKLAETEERHRAEIARLETEAAESRDAAARDAQARAEAHADTLAAERERVRTDAERTLSAELAAAQERHDADITRLETEAGEKKRVATRGTRAAADGDRLPATAPSTSIALRPLEPVYRGAVGSSDTTDYYSLWRARSAAYAPRVETSVARPQRVDARRRRWTLSIAATVLILLTNNLESGSAPHQALATVEAAGGSHAIGPTSTDRGDASRAPVPGDVERHDPGAPSTGGNPDTGVSGRAPLSTLMLETMFVLVVMLLLRVTLFVGEGLVWHGLVVTLGFILLGFAVMRAPWGG